MVNRIEFECRIQEISLQDFWDVLYADGTAQQGFYKDVHSDENCSATEWKDGERVVSAQLPLNLPRFAASIIGGDRVKVQDTQTFEWHEEDGEESRSLKITATPVMMTPGASKFTVRIEYIVAEAQGGVLIQVAISANAVGPWGLTGTIESIMVDSTRGGVEAWLQYSDRYSHEVKASRQANPGMFTNLGRAVSRTFSRSNTGTGSAVPLLFKTTTAGETDFLQAIESSECSELDILEAVQRRRSLADMAREKLFNIAEKGFFSKTYQQCMMDALYCAEALTGDDPLTLSETKQLSDKNKAIRSSLQQLQGRKEEFLDMLREYEVENGDLVQRLASEVVKLKSDLTVARQDAMLAKQAQTEAERQLQDAVAATASMHQQQQREHRSITEAPELEEGGDGLRQPLMRSSAEENEESEKQGGGIPIWDAIVGFFCNRGQDDSEEERKQQGRADPSGSSS